MLHRIDRALPTPEQMDVVGEEFDTWRNAFRFNQGFELQSTLMPFALAHADGLSPAIRERFEIAARITPDEAKTGREDPRRGQEAPARLGDARHHDRDADDADPSARAGHSRRRLDRRVQGHDPRQHLPRRSCRSAADFHSGRSAAGCPVGLSFIGWEGGDEALLDLAVRLEPLLEEGRS